MYVMEVLVFTSPVNPNGVLTSQLVHQGRINSILFP